MWRADPSKRPTISSVVLKLKQLAGKQTSQHPSHEMREGFQSFNLERFISPELELTIKGFLDRLEQKCSHCREYKEEVRHIFERLFDIYGLLQTQHRLPSDVAVGTYCDVLLRLDRFLRITVEVKSVLLQAKSRRVVLQSNEFHRRLDELLELLAPQVCHPIHDWKRPQIAVQEDNVQTDESEGQRALPGASQVSPSSTSPGVTAAGRDDGAVKIVCFKSDRVNEKFKELGFALIDAPASDKHAPRLPWLIDTYDLEYNRSDRIGVGSFGEVYRATWLSTPVVIKFMGYEVDEDSYSLDMFFHELRVVPTQPSACRQALRCLPCWQTLLCL